jgi:hypothetical protein
MHTPAIQRMKLDKARRLQMPDLELGFFFMIIVYFLC